MPDTDSNYTEISLRDEEKLERIYRLRKIINENEILKAFEFDNAYLERFLYGADFNIEETFKRLSYYYELVKQYPEWFPIFGPLSKKSLIDMDLRMALPVCDKEGRPIYLVKLGNIDMNIVTMFDTVAMDDIWLENILSINPKLSGRGLCVILDIENYNWRMIKWTTPENTRISVKKMQALPWKDYRFHIVNSSFLVNATIRCIWPFLPHYIKKMIKFHFNDRESLHEHIDQQVLPAEYGGPKEYDYNDLYRKLYESNDEIVKSFQLYRTFK